MKLQEADVSDMMDTDTDILAHNQSAHCPILKWTERVLGLEWAVCVWNTLSRMVDIIDTIEMMDYMRAHSGSRWLLALILGVLYQNKHSFWNPRLEAGTSIGLAKAWFHDNQLEGPILSSTCCKGRRIWLQPNLCQWNARILQEDSIFYIRSGGWGKPYEIQLWALWWS